MRYGKADGAVVEIHTSSGMCYLGKIKWVEEDEVLLIRQKLLVKYLRVGKRKSFVEKIPDECEYLTVDWPDNTWIHLDPQHIESWQYLRFLDFANSVTLEKKYTRDGIDYYYDHDYTERYVSTDQIRGATIYDKDNDGYCFGADFHEVDEELIRRLEEVAHEPSEEVKAAQEELVHEETPEEAAEKVADMVSDMLDKLSK